MKLHRLTVSSASIASALALILELEGHSATWHRDYRTGAPVVLAMAPASAIESATAFFGGAL